MHQEWLIYCKKCSFKSHPFSPLFSGQGIFKSLQLVTNLNDQEVVQRPGFLTSESLGQLSRRDRVSCLSGPAHPGEPSLTRAAPPRAVRQAAGWGPLHLPTQPDRWGD